MRFDVLAREFVPVWAFTQADLRCFLFSFFHRPAIAQHAANQPERADANRGGAVNKHRAVFRVVSDLQKLGDVVVVWLAKLDGNVEVTQAQLFCLCFFFGSAMFARLAQVKNRFDAFGF